MLVSAGNQTMAQTKQLSLNDFFKDGTFRSKGVYGIRSMNDGEHYTVLENRGKKIVKYSYKTDKRSPPCWTWKRLKETTK